MNIGARLLMSDNDRRPEPDPINADDDLTHPTGPGGSRSASDRGASVRTWLTGAANGPDQRCQRSPHKRALAVGDGMVARHRVASVTGSRALPDRVGGAMALAVRAPTRARLA